MKILYVCHRFPYPPKRGGKIRPFNMIRHLSQKHEVTVASLARTEEEAEAGAGIKDHCAKFIVGRTYKPVAALRMVRNLSTRQPSSMGFFYSARLRKQILQELSSQAYDLIFVHCSSVAQYVEDQTHIPKILDFGDMDSQKWLTYGAMKPFPLSLGYYLEGLKVQLSEVELAKKFDLCTCTTKAELKTLDGFLTGTATGWFPNGVDAEAFKPTTEPYDPDLICFVGRMDYYPNQECMFRFCDETLPLIQQKRPSAKLVIVGADPSPAVQKLGERPGVTVTGSVPKVQPYVQKAALTIAPLNIARGTQNKILEALAMGIPTVSSEIAAGGVDAIPGEHILTAQSPEGYRDAVLRLLEDPKERQRFSRAGRNRMLSHHSWDHSMKKLDAIIETCMDRTHSRNKEARRTSQ